MDDATESLRIGAYVAAARGESVARLSGKARLRRCERRGRDGARCFRAMMRWQSVDGGGAAQQAPNAWTAETKPMGRRDVLKMGGTAVVLGCLVLKVPQAAAVAQRTIVNGVLSAYGLPQLPDISGFSPMLAQFDSVVVEFTYPSSWVPSNAGSKSAAARSAEGRASPLSVADYRRAEGAAVYLGPSSAEWQSVRDVRPEEVARLVLPGDATRSDPEFSLVRRRSLENDAAYDLFEFEHDTITVSGYNVERRSLVSATVIRGQLLALAASCSAARYKAVSKDLKKVIDSFRAVRL